MHHILLFAHLSLFCMLTLRKFLGYRYTLSLRGIAEMFLACGCAFMYAALALSLFSLSP